MGGQESGSEGGGIDVVENTFDVQKKGGDFWSGHLEGFYLMHEGEAGVGGAESSPGAALVWIEKVLESGQGGQPDCHYPFNNFRDGFEENNNTEGGGKSYETLPGLSRTTPLAVFGEGRW